MVNDQQVKTGAQLTLDHTPTGGVPGEHSHYYRRLLSAGYKGFLQGVIGGATLYGFMGGMIGVVVAGSLVAGGIIGWPAFVPIIATLTGVGLYKGASTFGNIGSIAAITAESTEINVKSGYLLDRYYGLPDKPEYYAEAREIERQLNELHETKPPKNIFHWKTVVACALLGAAIMVGLAYFAPFILESLHIVTILSQAHLITDVAAAGAAIHSITAPLALAVAGGIGALAGTMIGLDRYYVRRWLDVSENLLHDSEETKEAKRERAQEVERLVKASPTRGAETAAHRRGGYKMHEVVETPRIEPESVASIQPSKLVSQTQYESRLADIQTAMSRPTV
jgi:hypothetical protein